MKPLRLSIAPLKDRQSMKVTLRCAKCSAESAIATTKVLMVMGWRRLRYHLTHNPVSCPLCPECRKRMTNG